MNRTLMNRKARAVIAEIAEDRGLDRCELCGSTFGLAPAHRHPRRFYQGAEGLADPNEWLALCVECHTRMDDRSLTSEEDKEEIFNQLRP
jgi:hypothetical protein